MSLIEPIKVSIVSDVRLHRDGLAHLLSACPSIDVLGAHSVPEALTRLPTSPTRVALLDMPLRGFSATIDALRRIRSSLAVVAVGIRETASELLSCAAAGVDGYLKIDATVGDMVSTVERVAGTGPQAPILDRPALAVHRPLTQQELKVADLLNLGFGNKEIARRLNIEPCTAKNHVRNIMNKLNVHRRGEAVATLRALIAERFSTPVRR